MLPAPLRGDADDLPQLRGYDKAALDDYRVETRQHEATEELRLGYVAVTRAAHRLSVTSYCWSPRATPFGPSAYQQVVRDQLEEWGEPVVWLDDAPAKGDPNPYAAEDPSPPLAADRDQRGGAAAAGGRCAGALLRPDRGGRRARHGRGARVADWDAEVERLLVEARAERSAEIAVPLPGSLSASALLRLQEDADGFARELARPMPRPPSRAARFGTLFHAWVEGRFAPAAVARPRRPPGPRRR